jgi:hypothetical protein
MNAIANCGPKTLTLARCSLPNFPVYHSILRKCPFSAPGALTCSCLRRVWREPASPSPRCRSATQRRAASRSHSPPSRSPATSCWGSVKFWCGSGSGSGSPDPYLWLMDPDPDPDPTPYPTTFFLIIKDESGLKNSNVTNNSSQSSPWLGTEFWNLHILRTVLNKLFKRSSQVWKNTARPHAMFNIFAFKQRGKSYTVSQICFLILTLLTVSCFHLI